MPIYREVSTEVYCDMWRKDHRLEYSRDRNK